MVKYGKCIWHKVCNELKDQFWPRCFNTMYLVILYSMICQYWDLWELFYNDMLAQKYTASDRYLIIYKYCNYNIDALLFTYKTITFFEILRLSFSFAFFSLDYPDGCVLCSRPVINLKKLKYRDVCMFLYVLNYINVFNVNFKKNVFFKHAVV